MRFPQEPRNLFFSNVYLGSIAMQAERTAAARRYFLQAVDAAPGSAAKLQVATTLMQLGDMGSASDAVNDVLRADPANVDARRLRAVLDAQRRDPAPPDQQD